MELAKNQEHTVTIEGYGEGGMGVARIDGRVVFVHGALRGEKCRVLILKTLKSVAFAKVLEVIEPSSERITPDCPYFPRCGGCTYRHIRYEEELRLKKQRVQDNLSRIGGSDVTVEEILGAQDTLHYRNKAQYPVSKDGAVGFYRARTHEVIECEHCLLVKPEAAAAAEALREYMQSCRVAGYDEKTGRGLVRHLYIRSNAAGESLVCVLVNGDKLPKEDRLVTLLRDACPKCTGIVLGTNTKKGNVILGDRYRTLWGSDRLEDTLCGKTFRLSVPSFYQVTAYRPSGSTRKPSNLRASRGRRRCSTSTAARARSRSHCRITRRKSSVRRSSPRPSTTRAKTPRATALKTRSFSAAMRPMWQKSSRAKTCAPTSSPSTRRARAWPPTWWRASPRCSRSGSCTSRATARPWRAT